MDIADIGMVAGFVVGLILGIIVAADFAAGKHARVMRALQGKRGWGPGRALAFFLIVGIPIAFVIWLNSAELDLEGCQPVEQVEAGEIVPASVIEAVADDDPSSWEGHAMGRRQAAMAKAELKQRLLAASTGAPAHATAKDLQEVEEARPAFADLKERQYAAGRTTREPAYGKSAPE